MKKKTTMPLVDCFKFIFALLIFFLHVGLFGKVPYRFLADPLTVRLAVPYFFVAAGYFLARKTRNSRNLRAELTHYCKRLGIKLLVFEPISILILAAGRWMEKMDLSEIVKTSLQEILFYPRGSLWFIQATIVGVLLLSPFLIHPQRKIPMICTATVLFSAALLGNRYYFLIDGTAAGHVMDAYEKIFLTVRNGIFFGFPFLSLGFLISDGQEQIRKTRPAVLIACYLFSLALLIAECIFLRDKPGHDDNSIFASYILYVPLLFIMTAFIPHESTSQKTVVLRNLSTSIYLLHSPVSRLAEFILSRLHRESSLLTAGITSLIILLICAFVYRKKRQPFFGWLT